MIRLTERQVLSIHEMMIKATGGSGGVRDVGLLNSSLNAPFQSFGNKEVYPSLLSKAAALCRSIICNHPFFLEANGVLPDYTQQELIDLGLGIAAGNLDVNAILNWLSEHRA